jgi:hypothetical protein
VVAALVASATTTTASKAVVATVERTRIPSA